jgi:hypothetical protein
MSDFEIYNSLWLAGCSYDDRQEIIKALPNEQMELELWPEPENVHDQNAINVLFQGKSVGYVPAYPAMLLTQNYLERGCKLFAKLMEVKHYKGLLYPVIRVSAEGHPQGEQIPEEKCPD